ncbi:hypothetical protein [Slackia heliotrinireducens]|uniref:Uncharacterized protein n=1 Tax=Slackia heliotrinireducens (strain ATCC 29202 / DSM 20476 / NCTC 11029 / RHS 1) TaxID=471855 RepID=C7N3U8_SLAHD|nr:hypothetical protein [Slackia heliotrinireducens]ACV21689.1 hypothetical protein Shel_06300 [Slackia heliotrinireducens DSM 20476]
MPSKHRSGTRTGASAARLLARKGIKTVTADGSDGGFARLVVFFLAHGVWNSMAFNGMVKLLPGWVV